MRGYEAIRGKILLMDLLPSECKQGLLDDCTNWEIGPSYQRGFAIAAYANKAVNTHLGESDGNSRVPLNRGTQKGGYTSKKGNRNDKAQRHHDHFQKAGCI